MNLKGIQCFATVLLQIPLRFLKKNHTTSYLSLIYHLTAKYVLFRYFFIEKKR